MFPIWRYSWNGGTRHGAITDTLVLGPNNSKKFMMLHMDRSNAIDIVNTAEAKTGQKVAREEEK